MALYIWLAPVAPAGDGKRTVFLITAEADSPERATEKALAFLAKLPGGQPAASEFVTKTLPEELPGNEDVHVGALSVTLG